MQHREKVTMLIVTLRSHKNAYLPHLLGAYVEKTFSTVLLPEYDHYYPSHLRQKV